jgi:DNA (cytosine-5)-methyltransferase 1
VIILDLFCGAGGAARGYVQAGHTVYGVDNRPELEHDYMKSGAVGFKAMDALEAISSFGDRAGFIHASPPCQRYSGMSNCRPGLAGQYPDLVAEVRELLELTGRPWILENVPGAPLQDPVVLCGAMFDDGGGYVTYRHRLFEAGGGLTLAAPPLPPDDMPGRRKSCGWPHRLAAARAGHWKPGRAVSVSGHERRGPVNRAMRIDWMSRREDVAEAVAPYMTEWIGRQLG